jgi:hypothetical protein
MSDLLLRALDKYGPMVVALLIMAYLLYRMDHRADVDRAFFYNDLAQRIEDTCKLKE